MNQILGKEIHIIGGGTVFHVSPHLAISAPAYGRTARILKSLILSKLKQEEYGKIFLHLTKMAGGSKLETNQDVGKLIDSLIDDPVSKIIFMNAALCDFEGVVIENGVATPPGKDKKRLSSQLDYNLKMTPADKIIGKIRKQRKDIFLIGFKTTAGATPEEQYEKGMKLLKSNSCNLVLANDIHTKHNMILVPEMASYGNTTDRFEALSELVDIALERSKNDFSRTKVVNNDPVEWSVAPESLRKVVEYCVAAGGYKPFNEKTVGHFGYKPFAEGILFSSRRKQNYNEPGGLDLALVDFSQHEVTAYGGKPSAGVRSQYQVLKTHNQFNCIVHFHCPLKTNATISTRPQKYFECGSHQCGKNTADGIELYCDGQIGAVMLDKHGPNILFRDDIDPQVVIDFIESNFDLTETTR